MTDIETDGVPVTIDGTEIIANKGELLIDAAERNGVYIPRFCYHPRMEPVGMCRMCIVEVDTGRGPALQPSCMLECTDGMKVDTESEVTKKAQEGVLEFLLINHPLDCPVCDKGGECPLQDQTVAWGPGESRFVEEKRHNEKPIPISDLVLLDRERCILCDRCTRFAKDVAGDPLIHFINRGNGTEISTFPDEPFSSYFSGNTVQICPVGALTASSYRFKARPWDLEETETTCTGCSVGCRLTVQSSRNEVLRYVGVDIEPVNWGWLCDKGRFSFEAVNSEDRLTDPAVRKGDQLVRARWSDAVAAAADAIRNGLDSSGPSGLAVLGGARLTNESAYAWSKLAKGMLGTDNVDAQLGDGLPAEVVLGLPRATIADVCRPGGTIISLGPDPKEELAVLFLRLRHAVVNDGATLIELAPHATGISDLAKVSLAYRPGHAAELAQALVGADAGGVGRDVAGVPAAAIDAARDALAKAAPGTVTVLLGRQSLADDGDAIVDAAGVLLDGIPGVTFLPALRRGNVNGALDMGLAPGLLPGRVSLDEGRATFGAAWPGVPAGRGLDATGILQAAADGRIDTLVLLGADPLSDFPDRDLATRALAGARTVISLDRFLTESTAKADIVFPVAGFPEVSGTATNLEGRVNSVNQRVTAPGTAQADWVIAAELANRLGHDLGVSSVDELRAEIESNVALYAGVTDALSTPTGNEGVVVGLSEPEREPEPQPGSGDADADADDRDIDADDQAERDDREAAAQEAQAAIEDAQVAAAEAQSAGDAAPVDQDIEDRRAVGGGPALVQFVATAPQAPPALDQYSLRLVATRKLYDQGTAVQQSPSLAGLTPGTKVRVNPYDFERLGVSDGSTVEVTSSRGSVRGDIVADASVPRGSTAVVFNQDTVDAATLIDAGVRVNDVRIERGDV